MVMVSVRKTYSEVMKDAVNITGNAMAPKHASYEPDNSKQSINSTFIDRSFYECCQTEGVPILCRPLCNIQAMISDQTKPYMYTLC